MFPGIRATDKLRHLGGRIGDGDRTSGPFRARELRRDHGGVQENANLNADDDSFFNDKTSSFVIVEGQWEFFEDSNFIGKLGPTRGPGRYSWVEDPTALGPGSNDKISSLRSVPS